ncbi:restriction endonuclease subunit S [Bacteroides fragilis]|uniref:restriction endonuclease subunit S n=1 Tax=Bacteroides fragilis TaxID=817 RepID=UPI000ECE7ACC|nr:restriction endonuclease subunit S [Bacteroides fragilis]RGN99335.1 restriction endonuclease subunit S [Bacteroides fragilis]RGO60488.1 restriction endonuclease subunit S [Bacteroides fragilis]
MTISDTPHYQQDVPFEVPSSWVWCCITEVTNKITDGTHNSPINTPKGEYKYVTAKNIKSSGVILDNITFVSKEVHQEIYSRCNPEKGDILYIKDGATTGIATVNTLDEPFSLLSSVALIKPSHWISNKYLLYYLQSSLCYSSVRETMKGVGITRITLKLIEKWQIPLPPFAEQKRIAIEIEHWFALIDQIEQGKADLQTTIKHAKSKILDLAIHGKLVPQDPNDEPAIELLKRINLDFTPCDNGHYAQLPDSWSVVPMQMLCYLTDGEKQNGIERINLDVKYLRGEHDAKTLTSGKYVAANSLLILVDGENSGEVFRIPIDGYQGSTFKQLLINENMNEEYVLQVINLHRKVLRESKVGSAIPHLNKKLFKAIEVPIPPYNEQQRIVEAINKAFMSLNLIMESL